MNTYATLNTKKLIAILLALDAIFTIDPYFTWYTYENQLFYVYAQLLIELFIIAVFSFRLILSNSNFNKMDLFNAILFLGLFLYRIINHASGVRTITFTVITEGITAVVFFLLRSEQKKEVLKYFIYIFTISLIPAIIVYCFNVLGINIQHTYLESPEAIKVAWGIGYNHYFGAVMQNSGYVMKLCGIYDEPGRVGTIIALILPIILNKKWFRLKFGKISSVICIIAGLLSLSLAFYLLFILYIILISYYNAKLLNKKKIYEVFLTLAVLLVFVFILGNNETVQELVFSRISITKLLNNNRTSYQFDIIFDELLHSSKLFFGYGIGNSVGRLVDAASYKIIIFNYGIIGFAFLITQIYFVSRKVWKTNTYTIILLLFFILSFYQRGWIFPLYHWVILAGGGVFLSTASEEK